MRSQSPLLADRYRVIAPDLPGFGFTEVRHSVVRHRAGLEVINFGAPIDVMWMRLSLSTRKTSGRLITGGRSVW